MIGNEILQYMLPGVFIESLSCDPLNRCPNNPEAKVRIFVMRTRLFIVENTLIVVLPIFVEKFLDVWYLVSSLN